MSELRTIYGTPATLICHSGYAVQPGGKRAPRRQETVLIAKDCSHTEGKVTIEFQNNSPLFWSSYNVVIKDVTVTVANGYYWYTAAQGAPQPQVGQLMPPMWVRLPNVINVSWEDVYGNVNWGHGWGSTAVSAPREKDLVRYWRIRVMQ